MALTDNLVVQVKAESGQSVITDALSSATFSGAGTATLVNDGTYGYLWRITGGALTATLSGMGNWTDTTAKTTTLAARFRVSNRGSNYNRFIQVGNDASNGLFFGNAGSATGNLREGVAIAGSAVSTPTTLAYTSGDVITIVMTFNETTTTSDPIKSWKGTTGRSGTAADATGTCSVSSTARAIASAVLSVTTETLDLLNLAVWNRGLSDAEAASVADDIGQLWAGSAIDATASGALQQATLSAPTGTASGTVVIDGSATGILSAIALSVPEATATGTTGASHGSASAALGSLSLVPPTGTATGTVIGDGNASASPAAISLTAPMGSASGTVGASHGNASAALVTLSLIPPSGSAIGTSAGAGTIVTPVLKNNTGTVLANETGVIVNVYNATTGALIVHKTGLTSNASGVVTVVDAAIIAGTTYAYEVILSSARRLPLGLAA